MDIKLGSVVYAVVFLAMFGFVMDSRGDIGEMRKSLKENDKNMRMLKSKTTSMSNAFNEKAALVNVKDVEIEGLKKQLEGLDNELLNMEEVISLQKEERESVLRAVAMPVAYTVDQVESTHNERVQWLESVTDAGAETNRNYEDVKKRLDSMIQAKNQCVSD